MINLIRIFTLVCCISVTTLNVLASENINDPTTPIAKDPEGLKIQGVSESEGSFFCIINNKIYTTGDKILDFTISKIELEKVFFQDLDGKITEITF